MHKVYLLLRNNHQSGPFNVDELLQHDLKPADLVWEEGRSAGWSYPYEIESLKPFFHAEIPKTEKQVMQNKTGKHELQASDMDAPFASKEVTSKNVYVSLPADSLHRETHKHEPVEESLEDKAEAIRRRALAAAEHSSSKDRSALISEQKTATDPYELETKISRTTSEISEDYSAWLYTQQIEKKKKARKRKSFLMGASTVFLLATGFMLYRGMITSNIINTAEEEPIQVSPQQEAVQEDKPTQKLGDANVMDTTSEMVDSIDTSAKMASLPSKQLKVPSKSPATQAFDSQKLVATPVNNVAKFQGSEETKAFQNSDSEQVTSENVNSEVANVPTKKEKRRNKNGGFFDIFKSKEKKDKAETKSGSAAVEEGEVKRKPTPAPSNVNIAHFIKVSSNAPGENWMMGVTGLKLTLHNKSNETVKTAAVEVRYYNEDKDLLEKKVIYFNNVSPKASQTIAAPDHRLAERADYQLVSAVAREDGYVKQ